MARRALHLRWSYIKDRLMIFGVLLLTFMIAGAAVVSLLADPWRGLLVGALPVVFGLVVRGLTNGASYRLKAPGSPPDDRSPAGDTASPGDPFREPAMGPAEYGHQTAAKSKKPGRIRRRKSDAA